MEPFKFPKLQVHMIHFTMCRPRYPCMVPFAMAVSVIANKLIASKSRRVRNITNTYVVPFARLDNCIHPYMSMSSSAINVQDGT